MSPKFPECNVNYENERDFELIYHDDESEDELI